MRASDIRRTFLSFYEDREHHMVPSSPLIPTDPTLLFTIAGMVQFKPYLLGEQAPPYPRAASVQKCFRTENIEDVGTNARDCTLFEMLGNFSFGDYFKREACPWAWTLLTEVFGVDPERLYISYFEGDEETALEGDEETAEIWISEVGVDASRVLPFPKEDNFWHMGVAGPCGPSSEIYIDRGPAFGPEGQPSRADEPKNQRYQEIYNLVFMQFVQDEPFHVTGDLPRRAVDTGMGLERLAQILQDVDTVWDTDLMVPLTERALELTGSHEHKLLAILADHSRSAAFLIADGVTPSNEGRGYILRRVLRRAITHARQAGVEAELLAPMCERVVERFAQAYPELERGREGILEIVRREEQRFSQTLDAGLAILTEAIEDADGVLPGDVAFKLHDTYGFPLDITKDVVADAGLTVDIAGYEQAMDEQRTRSRQVTEAGKKQAVTLSGRSATSTRSSAALTVTDFLGYDSLSASATILGLAEGVEPVDRAKEGQEVVVVLDRTPFYPEGGGQVGDRGWISSADGRAEVLDTQRQGALVLHRAKVVAGELHVGLEVEASVSAGHRAGAERAHTATHVLHHTLRDVLGSHVRQMGSLVEPGRARFDFSHFTALDRESLDELEETINRRIASDDAVEWFETDYRRAVDELGAIAFFDEKYGDVVRVVSIGDYSRELCGGTHVHATGEVGLVKILSEGSIGSNLRRVDALTGLDGLRWVNERLARLDRAAELLRVPTDEIESGVERLLGTQKELRSRLDQQERSGIGTAAEELAGQAVGWAKGKLVVARRSEDVGVLRELAGTVRDKLGASVVILGTAADGSANLVAATSSELDFEARDVLRAAAERIDGGAGGKPQLAMAGGRRPEGLDEALEVARKEAEGKLS